MSGKKHMVGCSKSLLFSISLILMVADKPSSSGISQPINIKSKELFSNLDRVINPFFARAGSILNFFYIPLMTT